MGAIQLSATDGFVLAMLAVILLSAGVIVLLIWCGLRNAARRNPQVDELLEELEKDDSSQKRTSASGGGPEQEPWEKEGDWWKK